MGNARVRTPAGSWTVDLLFPAQRLVIEVDGYEFHSGPRPFEHDRHRQNALHLAGYRVLRFTWAMITTDLGGVLATIRSALADTAPHRRAG